MNRTRNQFVSESNERGQKAIENGLKAGDAGLHLEAANFYGIAALAFMGARNDAQAYEADGFRQ